MDTMRAKLVVTSVALFDKFLPGQKFYADFTPAD